MEAVNPSERDIKEELEEGKLRFWSSPTDG